MYLKKYICRTKRSSNKKALMDMKGWHVDQNLYTVVRSAKRNRIAKQASVFKNMVDTCLHAYRYKKNEKGVPVQAVIHNLKQYEQYFPNEAGGRNNARTQSVHEHTVTMYSYPYIYICSHIFVRDLHWPNMRTLQARIRGRSSSTSHLPRTHVLRMRLD